MNILCIVHLTTHIYVQILSICDRVGAVGNKVSLCTNKKNITVGQYVLTIKAKIINRSYTSNHEDENMILRFTSVDPQKIKKSFRRVNKAVNVHQ